MGRQIQFHMLPSDCALFLEFLKERDPVTVTARDADSPKAEPITNPCDAKKPICLWNRSLLPSLTREYIANADGGPYYRVDDSLPVLEFSPPMLTEWEGLPAILQGRVWGAFKTDDQQYRAWFEAIVRWIRKTYMKTDSPDSYISPSVQEWRKSGGVLLPMFTPPVTDAWKKFVDQQLVGTEKH